VSRRIERGFHAVLQQTTKEVKKSAAALSKSSTTLPSYPLNYVLFPSGVDVEIDLDEMIGAQNILEEHVLRVWDDQLTSEHDAVGLARTTSAHLPSKSFHRRLTQPPIHPSPDVSFCRPDFDVSCCSEMDCSIDDDDRRRNGLPDTGSSAAHHRLVHSTPKSKSHVLSKYLASQSDSEMWDDCGSSVEQRSGSRLWNTSEECTGCRACQPHFSSQPNLPAAVSHAEYVPLHHAVIHSFCLTL